MRRLAVRALLPSPTREARHTKPEGDGDLGLRIGCHAQRVGQSGVCRPPMAYLSPAPRVRATAQPLRTHFQTVTAQTLVQRVPKRRSQRSAQANSNVPGTRTVLPARALQQCRFVAPGKAKANAGAVVRRSGYLPDPLSVAHRVRIGKILPSPITSDADVTDSIQHHGVVFCSKFFITST